MILVTGGTGLVGSHLLYHLCLKKQKVRAIYRNRASLENVKKIFSCYSANFEFLFSKIEWVKGDVVDLPSLNSAFKEVNIVYHCAALVSFNPKDYVKMRKINIGGTANMVNLSLDFGVKKFCHVSSIATLGNPVKEGPVTEENSWQNDNKSGYAISKFGAEQEVWRASQEGLNVVIVNPGVIIGPGFWRSGTGLLFSKIYNGFNFYSVGVTGFVGVNDVVKAMLSLTESAVSLERFILVSNNLSYKDILNLIAESLNAKKPKIKITPFLGGVAWRLDWLKNILTHGKPLFTRETARSLQKKTCYSAAKIEKVVGFKFSPVKDAITAAGKLFLKDITTG